MHHLIHGHLAFRDGRGAPVHRTHSSIAISLSHSAHKIGSFDNDEEYMRAAIAEIKETPIDNRKLHNRRGQAKLSFTIGNSVKKARRVCRDARGDDRAVVKTCDLVSWPDGASLC